MYAPKGTRGAGSRAEWDAATPNTLEVRSDRIWLSWAHFGPSVIVRPHIFRKSGGKAHPKRIASLLFQHWDTPKIEYEKVPMWQPKDIRGGRPQALSIYSYIGRTAKIRSSLPGQFQPKCRFAAISSLDTYGISSLGKFT